MPSTEVDIKTPFEFTDAILVEYCSATVRAMAIRHFFFKNFQPIRELLLDSERANILILSLSVICVTVNLTSGFRGILTINPIPYPVAMVSLQYLLLLLLFSLVYRAVFLTQNCMRQLGVIQILSVKLVDSLVNCEV